MKVTNQDASVIGCEIGGIDPSIIRELSGVYKPFPKAFKELISNAFDADADSVRIQLSEGFEKIDVIDDGRGMTPFEFRAEFTRLGGSNKVHDGVTKKGRRRIGRKGIGFLAVARYCSGIEVESKTLRVHRGTFVYTGKATKIDVASFLDVRLPSDILVKHLNITSVTVSVNGKSSLLRTKDFKLDPSGHLIILQKHKSSSANSIHVAYQLDCRRITFKAVIDFDYLLGLENKKDLTKVFDFCELKVFCFDKSDDRIAQQYTIVSLVGLKDFVRRDLKSPKRIGRVRNIESESGIDRFVWNLSRCTPIKYDLPETLSKMFGDGNFEAQEIDAIAKVVICRPNHEEEVLKRPLWAGNPNTRWLPSETISKPVEIQQEGLTARGYLFGHREAIFPAEYRGIAVRVHNVQIGVPGFFGLERTLSGPARSLLSQITGEINVFEGLDGIDSLDPGREAFHEENLHYKILRKHIVGEGEGLQGLLGVLIELMMQRMQVLSGLESHLSRADNYRAALINLSMAINHYGTSLSEKIDLKGFFASSSTVNGLGSRENFSLLPGPRLAGFRTKSEPNLEGEHLIDFVSKTISLNLAHERWNNRIFVLGYHYEIVPKIGCSEDPLCEVDTSEKKIYVNWGHPLRSQMGDVAFLKSAVAWKLSYHACRGDIEAMMDLALNLLTFNGA